MSARLGNAQPQGLSVRLGQQGTSESAFDRNSEVIMRAGEWPRLVGMRAAVSDIDARDPAIATDDRTTGATRASAAIDSQFTNTVSSSSQDTSNCATFCAELGRRTVARSA
jgi:hypothetical protein